MHKYATRLLLGFFCLLLAACNDRKGMLPTSGGSPYEVTVVGDVDSILYKALSIDVEGLPQREPMFDVSEPDIKPAEALKGVLRYARSLVVVDINPKKYDKLSIACKRNMYAEPQLIVRVCAPAADCLRSMSAQDTTQQGDAHTLVELLKAHESKAYIETLQRKHNPKMEAEVKRMFGFDIPIPADMKSCKRGKDFLWISNDSPTAMQNICIYKQQFRNRDSVMQVNIKGETDSMYMTTVHDACSVIYKYDEREDIHTQEWRGLWEMKGDAMGGPFVSHTLHDIAGHKTLTIESFVYAPGTKKRNTLMRTEASLMTVKAAGR